MNLVTFATSERTEHNGERSTGQENLKVLITVLITKSNCDRVMHSHLGVGGTEPGGRE